MFHDAHPEGCPTDLWEKQSFLRAHALLALRDGNGTRAGPPEIRICCRCAKFTTRGTTSTAGSSRSDPTANSPSRSRTGR